MKLISNKSFCAAVIVAVLGLLSAAALADNGSAAPTAGVKKTEPGITVGALARMIVSEVAVNSPSGGFDESSALGIMGAVGYDAKRPTNSVATVADLRSMLSILGVETKTENPGDLLTTPRLEKTLNAVRSTLPHFSVPVSDSEKTKKGEGNDNHPGPCQIALQACKARCQERSPSGHGEHGNGVSGCVQECNAAFDECQRKLFSHTDGR